MAGRSTTSSSATASQAAPTPPPTSELNSLLGPWLFGSLIASVLVGLLFVQSFIYYHRFGGRGPGRDSLFHQAIVAGLVLASVISWAATLQILDYAFLQNFGSPDAMHLWPRTVMVPLLLPAFSALFSQTLFGVRVWKLSKKSKWVLGALLLLNTCSLVSGLVAIGSVPGDPKIAINGSDVRFLESQGITGIHAAFWKTVGASEIFLWISAVTDTVISCGLVYWIPDRRTIQEDVDEHTDAVLSQILIASVTTGGLTAMYEVAVALVIIASVSSSNAMIGLTLQQAHVYALVVVGSLNFRVAHRSRPGHTKGSSSTTMLRTISNEKAMSPRRLRVDTKGADMFRLGEKPMISLPVEVHSQVHQRFDTLGSPARGNRPVRFPAMPTTAYTGVYPVAESKGR